MYVYGCVLMENDECECKARLCVYFTSKKKKKRVACCLAEVTANLYANDQLTASPIQQFQETFMR
jgi:hypothetical protein